MKQKLRLFTIHQTVASLQQTNILNPSNIWYPALDESNRMEYAYFIIHQGKILLLKMVANWNPFFKKSTGFTSSTFPIQPDFSQNQPAAITLNTGSPRTLVDAHLTTSIEDRHISHGRCVQIIRSKAYFRNIENPKLVGLPYNAALKHSCTYKELQATFESWRVRHWCWASQKGMLVTERVMI